MKAAIKVIRNREMGSYKASKFFNVPQMTLEHYVKDQQKSASETVKTKLGRKQVLSLWSRKWCGWTLSFDGKNVFWLDSARRHASHLPTCCKKRIKNWFCKRNEKVRKKWLKNFLRRHPQISVKTPEGFSLSRARGFTPESVVNFFFKSTNPQCTPT